MRFNSFSHDNSGQKQLGNQRQFGLYERQSPRTVLAVPIQNLQVHPGFGRSLAKAPPFS